MFVTRQLNLVANNACPASHGNTDRIRIALVRQTELRFIDDADGIRNASRSTASWPTHCESVRFRLHAKFKLGRFESIPCRFSFINIPIILFSSDSRTRGEEEETSEGIWAFTSMTIQERASCLILNYTRKPNERERERRVLSTTG